MKVVVKPLNKNPWSGVIQYKDCTTSLGPYFTRSGRIYTGLSVEDEKRLGEILRIDLSPVSVFWKTFQIKMTSKDLILDTEDPYEELKYLFLKSHKRVANGMADKKATANYVIINEVEEAKELNKYNKQKRKAFKEFDKLSVGDMRKCLRLYGYNAEEMDNELAEQKLSTLVDEDPHRFLMKWVENDTKEIEFLIETAIAKNVVRKNKNIYKYGTEVLGTNLEAAVDFLNNNANQEIKLAIINETKVK